DEMISLLFELINSLCLFIARIISCSLIAYAVNFSFNIFNECFLITSAFLNRFTKYIAKKKIINKNFKISNIIQMLKKIILYKPKLSIILFEIRYNTESRTSKR